MRERPSIADGAAARASGPARRRHPDSLARLTRLSDRLDALLRDVSTGPATSHRELERRTAEAEDIAGGLRAVFREPTPARPINPPLAVTPGGAWF